MSQIIGSAAGLVSIRPLWRPARGFEGKAASIYIEGAIEQPRPLTWEGGGCCWGPSPCARWRHSEKPFFAALHTDEPQGAAFRMPRCPGAMLPTDEIHMAKPGQFAADGSFVDQPLGCAHVVEHVRVHVLGNVAHARRVAVGEVGIPQPSEQAAIGCLRGFQHRHGCSSPGCRSIWRGRGWRGGRQRLAGCADQGRRLHERLRGHNGLLIFVLVSVIAQFPFENPIVLAPLVSYDDQQFS